MAKHRNITNEVKAELDEKTNDLLESLVSAVGSNSIMKLEGTTGLWPEDRIIHTGSIELDMALGIGGWPRGRMLEIHGFESSGKTTTAIMAVKEAQKVALPTVYIDAENSLDPNWMRRLGVDIDKVLLTQPNNLEDAIDLMMLAMERSPGCLIILDSVAAMKSAEVMGNDAGTESSRAPEARRWSTQAPRVNQKASETGSTLLFINQMRESMSMYTPSSTPGGRTLKFNYSVRVEIKKVLEGKNNEDGIDFHISQFKVVKNKVGSPFKKGRYFLYTREGEEVRNYEEEIVNAGIKYGILNEDHKFDDDGELISKKGWYSLPLGPKGNEAFKRDEPDADDYDFVQAFRMGAFLKKLNEHPSLYDYIEEQVYDSLNVDLDGVNPDDVDRPSDELPDGYESVDEETGELVEDNDDADDSDDS